MINSGKNELLIEMYENHMFESVAFPIVRRVFAHLASQDLISVTPNLNPSPITETYINIWGEEISKSANITFVKSNNNLKSAIPGTWGHDFLLGYYIINEDGAKISLNNEDEYNRISKKYEFRNNVLKAMMNEFKKEHIYIGPNDSVCVDDKLIIPNLFWGVPENKKEMIIKKQELIIGIKKFFNTKNSKNE